MRLQCGNTVTTSCHTGKYPSISEFFKFAVYNIYHMYFTEKITILKFEPYNFEKLLKAKKCRCLKSPKIMASGGVKKYTKE